MKVSIVSYYDVVGGAARAAFRLHSSLLKSSTKSTMLVINKKSDDYSVAACNPYFYRVTHLFFSKLSSALKRLQRTNNPVLHSLNIFGSSLLNIINKSNADIINIHWINSEALSIKQISKINKPVVMTLHDMWAFCGAEHYTADDENSRFKLGYQLVNKDVVGVDVNKLIWRIKKRAWKHQTFTVVTPSTWLTECAKQSQILSEFNVVTIPNALDTDVYKPLDVNFCKLAYNLPLEKKLIGFGAIGGAKDPRKGFDLLMQSMILLSEKYSEDYVCVVFGQSEPEEQVDLGFPVKYVGHLNDDTSLAIFYNAVDVMVVPSMQEAFGQTASEALSCGTPAVAFNTTGLKDVIVHKSTGYLAQPFDVIDLATGVEWCLSYSNNRNLGINAREFAVKSWSYESISEKYNKLFNDVIKNNSQNVK